MTSRPIVGNLKTVLDGTNSRRRKKRSKQLVTGPFKSKQVRRQGKQKSLTTSHPILRAGT